LFPGSRNFIETWEKTMPRTRRLIAAWLLLTLASRLTSAEATSGDSPADNLPSHISRITGFGERPDWSHDGTRILFLSKTFGDAMEIDLSRKTIRNLTAHYAHHGYTRALYLSNGDILLSGPEQYDAQQPGEARVHCWLYVLDRSGTKTAQPLGTQCSEGPAVSRTRLHIAWTHVAAQYPDAMPAGTSRMQEADIAYENGPAKLVGQKLSVRISSQRCSTGAARWPDHGSRPQAD
jgi:hypothetical protein